MFTKPELEATKELCARKREDILRKGDAEFTAKDLMDLCTLAQLEDAANKRLKPTQEKSAA